MTGKQIQLCASVMIIVLFGYLSTDSIAVEWRTAIAISSFCILILASIGILLKSTQRKFGINETLKTFFALGFIIFGVTEVTRLVSNQNGFDMVSDCLWILHNLMISFGLIFVVYKIRSTYQISYLLLDLHISTTVIGAISFVTYQKFAANGVLSYTMVYPLGDLYVLFILITLFLIAEKPVHPKILNGIFFGVSISILSSILIVLDSIDGVFYQEKYLLLYGFGTLSTALAFKKNKEKPIVRHKYINRFKLSYSHWELIRPIIQYTSVFVLLYELIFIYRNNNVLFGSLIATFILVICRDLITITQNQSLVKHLKIFNQHLEKKIGERTQELTDSHKDLEDAFKQIDYIARHDTLSRLPNRRYLEQMIEWKLLDSKRNRAMVSLIFIDVDRLKHINDTLGHSIGDQLLLLIIERIKSCIPEDAFLARHGGDEFAIVVDGLYYVEELEKLTSCIIEQVEHPFTINDKELSITVSIGVSIYPDHGDTVEELMKHADLAMYKAKEERQNKVVHYDHLMNQELAGRMELLTDLHMAIKRKEFVIHYQPQFNIQTGLLSGIEALVRWKHPVRGLVSPAEFIPLAEEFDLIIAIDDLVMETAIGQFNYWRDKGVAPPRLSVNLSPQQFLHGNLIMKLSQLLKKTMLPPNKLMIEITENVAMDNEELLIAQLNELASMGIQISIDDFGTGYSSLSYVKNYPLDQLKIARPFIMDVPGNFNDIAMIKTIIDLSHHFNLSVVVEGVETIEQFNFLQSVHCEEVQGFYFSKPLPADELEYRYLLSVVENK